MRGKKIKYFNLLIILLLCFSIGYAVLNSTLTINGTSNISKNTWDVHFQNIQITDGSVEAIKSPVIDDSISIGFEVTLDKPGDYYEFTVDVVNLGTIDAMIDSIEKTHDLSDTQKKYLNYIVDYQNEDSILLKNIVKANSFVKIRVRVEYKEDISVSDLLSVDESLDLGFVLNYVQKDDMGIAVNNNGVKPVELRIVSGDLDTPGSEFCIGNECFYVLAHDDGYIGVLTKYNLYVGNYLYLDENGEEIFSPLKNPTGIQSSIAKGICLIDGTEDVELPIVGGFAYSKTGELEPEKTDIIKVLDYYGEYISNLGYPSFEQAPMLRELLYNLGCDFDNNICTNTEFDWLYSSTYWLTGLTGNNAYVMISTGQITSFSVTNDYLIGVRPFLIFEEDVLKS